MWESLYSEGLIELLDWGRLPMDGEARREEGKIIKADVVFHIQRQDPLC